jgi:uncharacterized protein
VTTFYFTLAFVLTWVPLVPPTLATLGVLPGPVEQWMAATPISVFAPAIAGLIAARREGGRAAMWKVLGGLKPGGVNPLWFVLALAVPTLLYLPGRAVYGLVSGGAGGAWVYPPADLQHVLVLFFVPIGEEIGWRGFAMPRLVERHGALKATLLLSALWGVWHVPMFICQRFTAPQVVEGVLFIAIGNVFFSWFFLRSGGRLLVAVLLHAGVALNNFLAVLPGNPVPLHIAVAVYAAAGGLVVAFDRRVFRV